MFRYVSLALCFVLGTAALEAQKDTQNKEQARLANCGVVMQEILDVPDNIPQELLEKAECVIVIPSMTTVAAGIGGTYGRGAMVCRSGKGFNGPWGAPAMYALEGGSFGLQLGAESTDLVLREEHCRSGGRPSSRGCAGEECSAQQIEQNDESIADAEVYWGVPAFLSPAAFPATALTKARLGGLHFKHGIGDEALASALDAPGAASGQTAARRAAQHRATGRAGEGAGGQLHRRPESAASCTKHLSPVRRQRPRPARGVSNPGRRCAAWGVCHLRGGMAARQLPPGDVRNQGHPSESSPNLLP